jgi:uncharacterized protein (DUF2235 family)
MLGSPLNRRITRWLQARFGRADARTAPRQGRDPTIHVVIIDGTMSSLDPDYIGNAGLTYRLLQQMGSGISLYYQPGVQWSHWRKMGDIIAGRGINRQIRAAYSWLASRYRPGDQIFLFGFSRGAYAVRSLAGIIDQVGLLTMKAATERNVRDAYRHYRYGTTPEAFRRLHCHADVPIQMIGVWDTVKALGLNLPLLWRLSARHHDFHNHTIGTSVRHAYHALARSETRIAYDPVLWRFDPRHPADMKQMWFRGTHGDIGGQVGGYLAARPLANIPLVWMLERAQDAGLPLPEGWAEFYPQDPAAPSTGTLRGAGRWLVNRRPREIGVDPSERVHPSVSQGLDAQFADWSLPGFLRGL